MKKANVIQLIASLCLLFGSIINLVKIFTDIPYILSLCSIPLLIASIILYGIYFRIQVKNKKKDEDDGNK